MIVMTELNKQHINHFARQPLKTLDLYYHNANPHQTWQGGDLSWGFPPIKLNDLFDHVIFQDHVLD